MKLDLYGSDILKQWKESNSQSVQQAFELFEANDGFHIELVINNQRISNAEDFAIVQQDDWDARRFSLRTRLRSEARNIEPYLALKCLYLSFGFILLLADVFKGIDSPSGSIEGEIEGDRYETKLSRAERSTRNRLLCIQTHGTQCAACGFDFGKTYGPIAEGFIEVHHLTPLSSFEEATAVDPVTNMVPLCPNCHAVAHRKNPPLTLNELQKLLERNDR